MKKLIALLLALMIVVACFAGCSDNNEEDKKELKGLSADIVSREKITSTVTIPETFKIGMICLHDENSTYDNNFIQALEQVKKDMGLKDEQVVIVKNIPESSACYDTAIDLAKNQKCDVVFADSYGHDTFMANAAAECSKEGLTTQFIDATGICTMTEGATPNFHNAFASIYEGRYCAGIAAGMKLNEMIAAGKITAEQAVIGYVGAFTYAEVISGMTSFFLGARSVCPSATMKVRYTGSWYDPGKETEAANALITNDKCVLISQHADSMGAPSACEIAGVPNVSYNGATYKGCENTFIVSSAVNWAPYFQLVIEAVAQGKEFPANWTGTFATNSVLISAVNQDVAAEGTIEAINNAISAFKAGTLKVFDTSKFTVKGETITEYLADIDGVRDADGNYHGDQNVISEGFFDESNAEKYRSAPYFDIIIDGVENKNSEY